MTENSFQNKNLLACFSYGNKVQTSVNNRQEIRFPILKGGYDDGFEVDWGTWTELKLASGCLRIFTEKNSDKQQLVKDSWRLACSTTKNLLVSLKISWKKHSLNMSPFPSECSHSKKIYVQLLLLAVCYSHCLQRTWCQLKTLEETQTISKPSWSFL